MPSYPKTTSDIRIGNWTTIQFWATALNELDDDVPLDDVGGPGPYLVMENGIWKYPQQDATGAFVIPEDTGMPVRLIALMADFGAVSTWSVVVTGDNNVSGTPYAPGDAALYADGLIVIDTGSDQYVSKNYNIVANSPTAVLYPGQRIYVATTGGDEPRARLTLSLAYDLK